MEEFSPCFLNDSTCDLQKEPKSSTRKGKEAAGQAEAAALGCCTEHFKWDSTKTS